MSSRKQSRLTAERLEDRLVPAGGLDAVFDTDGLGTINFGGTDTAQAVAVQPNGRIVVAGTMTDAGDSDFAVARFLPGGKLDPFFNGPFGGTKTVGFGGGILDGTDVATAVAVQPDGMIVVAGYTSFLGAPGDENDFAIARFTPTGQLDKTFDGDGLRTIEFGGDDRANAVAIDALGRIVVAGSSDKGGLLGGDFAVARLEVDGKLDAEFNGPFGGTQTVGFSGNDVATGIAVQPDGKIVLVGHTSGLGAPADFAVARLTSAGRLDDVFSDDGKRTLDFGADDRAAAVAVQPNGRIVVAGATTGATNSDFAIARFLPDGKIDGGFNGPIVGGTQTVTFGGLVTGSKDFATGVAVQPDGRIVVTGYTDANGSALNPNNFAAARLTAGGELDAGFAGDGKATVDFGGNDRANGVALQQDGRIVLAGATAVLGLSDFAVARLEGDTAGLSVAVTDGVGSVTAGGTVTYTVTVTNAGPDQAAGAKLADAFPAALTGVSYTSAAAGGATGNTASGSGDIADALTLPAGTSVTYTVTATVSPTATGTLSNTATLTPPAGVLDPAAGDNSATDTTTITPPPNTAPTISDIGNQAAPTGTAIGPVAFTVGDAQTAPAALTVSGVSSNPALVPNASIVFGGSEANRTVTVTPAAGQSGTASVTVTVTDAGGLTATDTFTVTVSPAGGNTAPTISDIGNQTAAAGSPVGPVAFTVGDAQTAAAALALSAASSNPALLPAANIVFGGSGADRTITVTPVAGQSGTATVTVTVTDAGGLTATDSFTVTVSPAGGNTAPTISDIGNQTAAAGTAIGPVAFTVGDAETPAGDLVVTAASSNPALVPDGGIVLGGSGANRTVTITPAAGQSGVATITVTVADPNGGTAADTFTVQVGANTPPTVSDIPDQAFLPGQGSATPPFAVGDAETGSGGLTLSAASSNPALLPAGGITFGGSGANRTVTITPTAGQSGTATVTVTVTDEGGLTATDSFTVTVPALPGGPGPVAVRQFAAGADRGAGGVVFYDPDQSVRFTADPFPGSAGGVRTAAGDFNADGIADLVVGTGPGRGTQVRILDGKTQAQIFSIDPFEAGFTGGVYVAAGDLTGDGRADLVITPDEGGGPRVRTFDGQTFDQVADIFGIDDPNFRGGARAAVGDVDGDGTGDLIVAAGFQGGPRVAGFSGKSLGTGSPRRVFGDFFAFEQTLRNGVFVAAGDIDGDGFAEVIAGGGPGGGPRVTAFSGKQLQSNQYDVRANFFGGDPDNRGGVRVAVKDLDGDARADLVVGSGTGAGSRVTGYFGATVGPAGTPPPAFDIDAFPGFTGGVFVG